MSHDVDDDKTIIELEEQLVREHYGLVVSQALSFLSDNKIDLDDYIQAGFIGLLKAIRNHDESKSKFSTFASVCIRNEILNLKRKHKKNTVVFDENLVTNNQPEEVINHFSDYLPDGLDEEEKFIVKLKLMNYNNAEIAEHLSCSKSTVSNRIKRITTLIKESNE